MKQKSPWRVARALCTAAGALLVLAAAVAAAACPEALLRPKLGAFDGVESADVQADGVAMSLRLVRFSPQAWSARIVDMRELRDLKARKGDYTSPSFSLAEVAAISAPDRIFSSAGLTESLYAPAPVGLLKTSGRMRSKPIASSRILDGVVCVRADRSVALLSEQTPAGRRIPQAGNHSGDDCVHAVQAGPMLLDAAKPLIPAPTKLDVARVFAATDREGRFVLGYSPQATTFALACVLSAPALRLESAIALQSDELGGVVFGSTSGFPAATWGRSGGAIASAIELVARKKAAAAAR